MKIFEIVRCNLCNSSLHEHIYNSEQYLDADIGRHKITLVRCLRCSFIFQNPQLTSAALKEHYSINSSGNIFRVNSENSIHSIFHKEVITLINHFIQNKNVKTICDIGGAKGQVLRSINNTSNTLIKYLIEPSDAINECLDEDIIKIKSNIEDIDIYQIPKIDFLMCIATLEHLKDPLFILRKLKRLMSNNGFFFLEVPNSLKPYETFAEFYHYEHVNHFTIKTILSFLTKAGFYPIHIEESKFHPSIKIVAKKNNISYHTNECNEVFLQYTNQKEVLERILKEKLKASFKINKDSIFSIYGAGDHTRFILEKTSLLKNVKYFIDSDPKKWNKIFYNRKIISPKEIDVYNITDILISSHDFEEEIYKIIKDNTNRSINIIKLYN